MWITSQIINGPLYALIKKETGFSIPLELQKVLNACGEPFIDLRYRYEDPSKAKFVMSELPRMLFNYILELRPDWR